MQLACSTRLLHPCPSHRESSGVRLLKEDTSGNRAFNRMISHLLFESPWVLLTVLVALQLALISLWLWRRTRKSALVAWLGFAAIPLLLVLSHWVVTPREQLIELCLVLASAVETADMVVLEKHLATDFDGGGLDRSQFIERVAATLARYDAEEPRLWGFEVAWENQESGTVTFMASARIHSVDALVHRLRTQWRLSCRREGKRWLVHRIQALPVAPLYVRNIADLLE